MGASYLKTALRSLWKHRGFTAINIVGLGVSLAVGLLALLFVRQQWEVDRFHSAPDRIHRVTTTFEGLRYATTPRPLSATLREQGPGIAAVAAVDHDETFLARAEKSLDVEAIETRPGFWEVFDGFRLQAGTRGEALARPKTAVVAAGTARELFGTADPVGQTFRLRGETEYTVTGVLAPVDEPTHVEADVYLSTVGEEESTEPGAWRSMYTHVTYVRLTEDTPASALRRAVTSVFKRRAVPEDVSKYQFGVQSLVEMQFGAGLSNDFASRFSFSPWLFWILGGLAAVLLLAAGFNYVNLAVARSLRRAREVGVRKTLGAHRAQLIGQFLGEAVLTALVASLVAVGLLVFLAPAVSDLYMFDLLNIPPLELDALLDPMGIGLVVGVSAVVGLLSGVYPAFVLSSYRPVQVLTGRGSTSKGGSQRLRAALITAQVAFTLILVVTATTMLRQTNHMAQTDFALQTDRMIAVPLRDVPYDRFRRAVSDLPSVEEVTSVSNLMLGPSSYNSDDLRSRHVEAPLHTVYYSVDTSFVETMGLDLLAQAPNWSVELAGNEGAILNEAAVEALGFASPSAAVGEAIEQGDPDHGLRTRTVVAVVEDFTFSGMAEVYSEGYVGKRGGLMLISNPSQYGHALVRAASDDLAGLRNDVKRVWTERLDTVYPFQAHFYDDIVRMRYGPLQDLGTITGGVAVLAILIAVLGLLSLAAFHVQQRVKEIGVRKALGATAVDVVVRLSRPFAVLVGGAALVATPVAWGLNAWWLRLLPDPVSVSAGVVGACVGGLVGLGVLTVATQALRATRIDPALTLRDE